MRYMHDLVWWKGFEMLLYRYEGGWSFSSSFIVIQGKPWPKDCPFLFDNCVLLTVSIVDCRLIMLWFVDNKHGHTYLCVGILSVWVEFDELYFSYLLKMLDLWVHVLTRVTGRVDCSGCVCAPDSKIKYSVFYVYLISCIIILCVILLVFFMQS